jgi:hypothetical protein
MKILKFGFFAFMVALPNPAPAVTRRGITSSVSCNVTHNAFLIGYWDIKKLS